MLASLITAFTPPIAMAMTLYSGVEAARNEIVNTPFVQSVASAVDPADKRVVDSENPGAALHALMTATAFADFCAAMKLTIPDEASSKELLKECAPAAGSSPGSAQVGTEGSSPVL